MKNIREKLHLKESSAEKLVYGVFPLPDYCIFSEMLKYLLENNMCVLESIYSYVEAPLGYVFRDFITVMTGKRQIASNLIREGQTTGDNTKISAGSSLKEFAKLNNNASFGKTLQSDENFNTSCIVKSREQFIKRSVGKVIIDFNVLAPKSQDFEGSIELKLKKNEHKIKSPKYIGSTALWVSKMLMLDFVYNCLWTVYTPNEALIQYMDTDSLYLKFTGPKSPTSYKDLVEKFPEHLQQTHFIKDEFDITPGKMKCEKIIEEAVFLQGA